MGCDIHVVAEVRTDGVWTAITEPIFPGTWYDGPFGSEPFGWRSYAMFTLFAGVRDYDNRVLPISQPKGFPADISDVTRELLDVCDHYHSDSWLTVTELMSLTDEQRDAVVGDDFEEHLAILRTLGEPDDVRIVFAFDS